MKMTTKAMLITILRGEQEYEFWREASCILVHSESILGGLYGVLYPCGALYGDSPIHYGGVSTKEFREICNRWLEDRLPSEPPLTIPLKCYECAHFTIRRTLTGESGAVCLCSIPIHGYYSSCAYMRGDDHECGEEGNFFTLRNE